MKPYKKQDVIDIYGDFMRSAYKNYAKYRLTDALKDIETAARWAYEFNFIYTDHEAEQLLKQIGNAVVDSLTVKLPKADRCVLIDSFLLDNRGLSQQYIRAMIANGMEILVVYTGPGGTVGKDTLAEIKAYAKARLITYNKGIDRIEMTRNIVSAIFEFAPAHVFLHLTPWDTAALMACNALKGTSIYQINLTDHAYWMGAEFIDYNLEFRPYGLTVSIEKRGLRREQCIALPYYPITPVSTKFAGFPELPANAVKVLTGGALYKMLGKDDIFFHIMEEVLSIDPNVYILVAGFNRDKRFDEKASKIKGRERVLQIGVRSDIDAVFEHCDIYLGTYPMGGGLMTQYAAKHAKPVLAYHDEGDVMNAIEEIVNHYGEALKCHTKIDSLLGYANRLICDKDYRHSQGKLLQNGLMNVERFNREFIDAITSHVTSFQWQKDNINYDAFFERYLELENVNGFAATKRMVYDQKLASLVKVKNNKSNITEELYNALSNYPPHLFRWLLSAITRRKR